MPEQLFPFLGTLAWVLLMAIIILRYGKVLEEILRTIGKRIAEGDSVKAGVFEISRGLKPQGSSDQVHKLEKEIAESARDGAGQGQTEIGREKTVSFTVPSGSIATGGDSARIEVSNARSTYFYAEDLALREIQIEFGVALQRQLRAGDLRFDGFFALGATAYIVEVKYVRNAISRNALLDTVQRLLIGIAYRNWKNFKLIVAIVIGDDEVDVVEKRTRVEGWLSDYTDHVIVRCYRFSDLEKKYGIMQ